MEGLMRAWMPLGGHGSLRAVPEIPVGQRRHGRPGRQAQGKALTLADAVETIYRPGQRAWPGRGGGGAGLGAAGRARRWPRWRGACPRPAPRLAATLTQQGRRRSTAPWCCGFPRPHSFTGEDVAEFHIHGGRAVREALFAALAALGLSPAGPGEFSRRAVENGRLDLTRAEAIADLVDAETPAQLRQALRQYDGALAELYEGWRADLIAALGRAEAAIDFSDDGVGEAEFVAGRASRAMEIHSGNPDAYGRWPARRGAARRAEAGHCRPAQCRQEFADQCPGPARCGDRFGNSRHHPRRDRAAARSGRLSGSCRRYGGLARDRRRHRSRRRAPGAGPGAAPATWCCCCCDGTVPYTDHIRRRRPI